VNSQTQTQRYIFMTKFITSRKQKLWPYKSGGSEWPKYRNGFTLSLQWQTNNCVWSDCSALQHSYETSL